MKSNNLSGHILLENTAVMLKRIAELEEQILAATPSDNWSIGEKSFTSLSLPISTVRTPVSSL